MRQGLIRPSLAIDLLFLLPVIFAALDPLSALAQGVPGSVEPGRVPQQLQLPPGPLPTPEVVSPAIPETTTPEEAVRVTFTLRRLIVEGSTVYSSKQLEPLYAQLLNKTVSLADIYSIADAITTKYRSDGYILSRAIVPAQRISNGEVHIRVVEGFINHVSFQGPADATLQGLADKLTQTRPLRAKDLERYLLLINDQPGVSARGVLSPSTGTLGGSDLTILLERKSGDFLISLDNRGTDFAGPLEFFSEADFNNPTGHSDRIGLRFVTTPAIARELRYYELNYALPIGSEGGKFSLVASGNQATPGSTLQTDFLGTEIAGERVQLRYSYPFIRSRAQNLVADMSFSWTNAMVDQFTIPSRTKLVSSYEDRIRALSFGLNYDTRDDWGGSDFARLELSQGLPIFNPSPDGALLDASRPGGKTIFTKLTLDASRLQDLTAVTPGLNLLTAISGGVSFGTSLLASEQFAVGGALFGRGYDPAELTGDQGFAVKNELQYDFRPDFLTAETPARSPAFQLFAFHDFGLVADQHPQLLDESAATRSLASAGIGVRATWLQYTANLELDKPLTRDVAAFADNPDPKPFRLYFVLTAHF